MYVNLHLIVKVEAANDTQLLTLVIIKLWHPHPKINKYKFYICKTGKRDASKFT